MDTYQAEIESLKSRLLVIEAMYREQIRELDARDRFAAEIVSDNTALKGQLRRMQTDRNSDE
tara:strand:+ start:2065 stop:2250 length:186 start_codon:yes stop_codon:yes gene_type:complete